MTIMVRQEKSCMEFVLRINPATYVLCEGEDGEQQEVAAECAGCNLCCYARSKHNAKAGWSRIRDIIK